MPAASTISFVHYLFDAFALIHRPDHPKLDLPRADLLAELPRALIPAGTF